MWTTRCEGQDEGLEVYVGRSAMFEAVVKEQMGLDQTKWHWQVHCAFRGTRSLLRTDCSYSSAWSCRTGKRIKSSRKGCLGPRTIGTRQNPPNKFTQSTRGAHRRAVSEQEGEEEEQRRRRKTKKRTKIYSRGQKRARGISWESCPKAGALVGAR